MTADVRIDADIHVVETADADAVVAHSTDATIVFLPMRLKDDQPLDPFEGGVENLVSRLPVTALAIAGEQIDLTAEPDEGEEGVLAALLDQAEDLERRAKEAENDAVEASEASEGAMQRLWEGATGGAHDELDRLRKEADAARAAALAAARHAAKARAVADAPARALPDTGKVPSNGEESSA